MTEYTVVFTTENQNTAGPVTISVGTLMSQEFSKERLLHDLQTCYPNQEVKVLAVFKGKLRNLWH